MKRRDRTRPDNVITFLHVPVITDLAPQVAEANRVEPGRVNIAVNLTEEWTTYVVLQLTSFE